MTAGRRGRWCLSKNGKGWNPKDPKRKPRTLTELAARDFPKGFPSIAQPVTFGTPPEKKG